METEKVSPQDSYREEKLCECGCGKATSASTKSRPTRGIEKGQPQRFFKGHHKKKYSTPYVVTDGPMPTPCWIFHATRESGYGYVQIKRGDVRRAHIVYYEKKYGSVPDGMELDHLCRNRACVNPDHVEPVTHAVNVQRGNAAKINKEIAEKIRAMYVPRFVPLKEVAKIFGLSIPSVYEVVSGKTWVK